MSKVSRSVYQKLKEENKRLLNDLNILTYANCSDVEFWNTHDKWSKHFRKEEEIHKLLVAHAKKYIRDHKDELPDFLTKNITTSKQSKLNNE